MPLLTTNTYSQSSRYSTNNAYATWANMNDGSCDTGTATEQGTSWVSTDMQSMLWVTSIVVGYDKNNVIYGGWGPGYSINANTKLQCSNDNSNWTDVLNFQSYSNAGSPASGLATVTVNRACRYLRIINDSYFALTEFRVDAAALSGFFQMF